MTKKQNTSAQNDEQLKDSVEETGSAETETSTPVQNPLAWKSIESDGVFVSKPLTNKAVDMGNVLARQPKVQTMIPLRDDEALGGSFHIVQINGFKVHVLKGVEIMLPEQLAKHILGEYTALAKATRSVAVRNPMTGELVNMNLDQRSETDRGRLGL